MSGVTDGKLEFAKLSGSGNDFICLDNLAGRFNDLLDNPARVEHFAKVLCDRGIAIGADGLVFACPSEVPEHADLGARFFEPDGSETELCGNGTACFAHWAIGNGWSPGEELRILTSAGMVRAQDCEDGYVRACIPLPEGIQRDLQVQADDRTFACDFAITGVPHLIIYVEDVDELEVAHWGPILRHHPQYQPRGVNANFVEVLREGELAVRTFEFGVEAETLACGTGSSAAAILAALRFGWGAEYTKGDKPVRIRSRGGDVLRVWFELADDGAVTDLCLETIVRRIYTGTADPDLVARAVSTDA
jgi:diaminopimelate epimerase